VVAPITQNVRQCASTNSLRSVILAATPSVAAATNALNDTAPTSPIVLTTLSMNRNDRPQITDSNR